MAKCSEDIKAVKPPSRVKGMMTLDKSLFDDSVKILALNVNTKDLRKVLKCLKKFKVKLKHVKPVVELDKLHPQFQSHRLVLLDPGSVTKWEDLPDSVQRDLMEQDISRDDLQTFDLQVSYENWNFQEVMSAVLPEEIDGVSGFSEIGHIAHFNLRDAALPYRHLIGQSKIT